VVARRCGATCTADTVEGRAPGQQPELGHRPFTTRRKNRTGQGGPATKPQRARTSSPLGQRRMAGPSPTSADRHRKNFSKTARSDGRPRSATSTATGLGRQHLVELGPRQPRDAARQPGGERCGAGYDVTCFANKSEVEPRALHTGGPRAPWDAAAKRPRGPMFHGRQCGSGGARVCAGSRQPRRVGSCAQTALPAVGPPSAGGAPRLAARLVPRPGGHRRCPARRRWPAVIRRARRPWLRALTAFSVLGHTHPTPGWRRVGGSGRAGEETPQGRQAEVQHHHETVRNAAGVFGISGSSVHTGP
jgi:hypothetical protein